jgi:glycosyltransferase involved in cell wall biosynthesis
MFSVSNRSMSGSRPLVVTIDGRLRPGEAGGVEQALFGLLRALSAAPDPSQRCLVLAYEDQVDQLRRHLGEAGDVVAIARPPTKVDRTAGLRRGVRRLNPAVAARMGAAFDVLSKWSPQVRVGDSTLGMLATDVVHFPFQNAFLTGVPSVYQPWDLQHRHLPEFFTRRQIKTREAQYRAFCQQAKVVLVASSWTKRDVIDAFGVDNNRIVVLPPPLAFDPRPREPNSASSMTRIEGDYLIYPAQPWPHKNHARLLCAAAKIRRDRGVIIPLVFTGHRNSNAKMVDDVASKLGIADQVTWTGFLEPHVLQHLVRGSRGLIYPSLFEGWGLPVWEAFAMGVPVACSGVTALADARRGAAFVIDPASIDSIEAAMLTLWSDAAARTRGVAAGLAAAREVSPDVLGPSYRAVYRAATGDDGAIRFLAERGTPPSRDLVTSAPRHIAIDRRLGVGR